MKIEIAELTAFLNKANKSTYANPDAPKVAPLRPASQDYHFEEGPLAYHDTYFGARDFIGEEVVYNAGKPVWAMNYYGFVIKPEVTTNEAYTILRPALAAEYTDIPPVRGPRTYREGEHEYRNFVEGTLERFAGTEEIYIADELVYRCWYHGGAVE